MNRRMTLLKTVGWLAIMSSIMLAAGCSGPLEMLSGSGEPAARIARLTWFMLLLGGAVYAVVLITTAVAIRRNRATPDDTPDLTRHGISWIIIGGVILPGLILLAVFIVSLGAMNRDERTQPTLTVSVVGHQWWWKLQYHPDDSTRTFYSANEIHIPVGRTVRLLLSSGDVIHSFWVPTLQGKLDAIPGVINDIRITADTAGIYRGVCAEFCGTQHANMAITVVAESLEDYLVWEAGQLENAHSSADSTSRAGQRLFVAANCAACHRVRGTDANGADAPDLTHVASRMSIGAGVLPMQPGALAGWIANAPAIKPGVLMPRISGLSGSELRLLALYVGSLK